MWVDLDIYIHVWAHVWIQIHALCMLLFLKETPTPPWCVCVRVYACGCMRVCMWVFEDTYHHQPRGGGRRERGVCVCVCACVSVVSRRGDEQRRNVDDISYFSTSSNRYNMYNIYTCILIERNTPPGGGSYLLCSLIKNPEEEDPSRRICTRCFEGGPLPPVSWLGNIVNRKPPPGGGVLSINIYMTTHLYLKYRYMRIHLYLKPIYIYIIHLYLHRIQLCAHPSVSQIHPFLKVVCSCVCTGIPVWGWLWLVGSMKS